MSFKSSASFVYFGVKNVLVTLIQANFPRNLQMEVNIDGMSLLNSSTKSIWPILASIPKLTSPFVMAIFYGEGKPEKDVLLTDFCEEMTEINENGVEVNGVLYTINIIRIVSDAPARSLIKCIKGHTGYGSCDRCVAKGSWQGRVVFTEIDMEQRTDESFRDLEDKDFHHGYSPLTRLNIDMVLTFTFDFMHVVCLGVVKRIISCWSRGPIKACRQSENLLSQISSNLLNYRKYFPSEFSRRPRALSDFAFWKAIEFRSFLLYLGMVAIKGIVKSDIFQNFCLLHSGIYLLCDKSSVTHTH